MKKIHGHIMLLILAASVTAVTAALYVYMFYKTSASVDRAVIARDIVRTEEMDQSQAKTLSSLASSTVTDRDMLMSYFVHDDDIVSFITTLESLGPQSGSKATLASIDADSLSASSIGTTGSVRAHVDVTGSWSSAMRALMLAEHLPYAASLSHVSLSSSVSGTVGAHSTWVLSFDVTAALIVASSTSSS